MFQSFFRISALLLILATVACSPSEGDGEDVAANADEPRVESIKGSITYTKDIPLAPESMITVELLDVSKADAPAEVVANTVFLMPGKPPLPFVLKYDANKIQDGHRYAVRAKIMEQTRLMFVSDTVYPVLEDGKQGPVEILVKHVPGGDVERMAETVRAKNPQLVGHYSYYGGEGHFTDCSDGVSHPVAREHDIYALESTYRDVAPEFGEEVFLRLSGKYSTRPARDGKGKEDYLVVLQIEEMSAGGLCP